MAYIDSTRLTQTQTHTKLLDYRKPNAKITLPGVKRKFMHLSEKVFIKKGFSRNNWEKLLFLTLAEWMVKSS